MQTNRTWTATITIKGQTYVAPQSEYDLLRDQTLKAVLATVEPMRRAFATDATVKLYKTTKARGTQLDRTVSVYTDRQGTVRYQ